VLLFFLVVIYRSSPLSSALPKTQVSVYFMVTLIRCRRRKIRLIEGNAKCRHLKKLTCKGTLRQVLFIEKGEEVQVVMLAREGLYEALSHMGRG
jgi:hypothetical protein